MKFYLIAGTLAAILFWGGYVIGWGQGRTEFANECITIGNFTVFDYRTDKQRRFKCIEVLFEQAPSVDNMAAKL